MHNKNRKKRSSEAFEILSDKTEFAYAEAFKALRTNFEFVTAAENRKVIMLASTLAGEGKTTVSINLAVALAQSNKRVLVIDCDLRRPKIHRYLRVKNLAQHGASTVLGGTADIDSAIGYIEELGIYAMLAGPIPPNPSELLSSENCQKMFESLRDRFDYIICDTPPVSVVSDGLALSRFVDGAILVVRQNYASRSQIMQAREKLENLDADLLGVVFNHYDSKADSSYKYKYDKYYKYNSYYESDKQ